jgi:hypothetical protein
MAVKTLSELITQSNNTFQDSPPANITPPNHRAWNVDAIDTMFSIAGRVVTKAQMDNIIADGELVAGTQYLITDYTVPFTNGSQIPVIITATSNSSIDSLCFAVTDVTTGQIPICWISQDLSELRLISWNGDASASTTPFNQIYSNGLPNGWYNYGAEVLGSSNNPSVVPYFIAEVSRFDNSQINSINVNGITPDGQKKLCYVANLGQGFLAPNNGGADDWGINDSTGNFKSIEIIPVANTVDPYPVQNTNFVKVNETFHGTFKCVISEASFQTGDATFDFTLPYPATSADYVVGHGHYSNTDNHIILITVEGNTTDLTKARATMRLYGNHNLPIFGEAYITFSYR